MEKRLDMLPKLLTETLCSVVGEADRFVFSVIWEMTPSCDVVSVDYHRSIVHSVKALSYGKAQEIHDDASRTDTLAMSIRDLMKLSRVLKEARMQAGAVTLASPEIRFERDLKSGDPTDVRVYGHVDTNSLVEEFMLLANIAVAQKIEESFPACVASSFRSAAVSCAQRGSLACGRNAGQTRAPSRVLALIPLLPLSLSLSLPLPCRLFLRAPLYARAGTRCCGATRNPIRAASRSSARCAPPSAAS